MANSSHRGSRLPGSGFTVKGSERQYKASERQCKDSERIVTCKNAKHCHGATTIDQRRPSDAFGLFTPSAPYLHLFSKINSPLFWYLSKRGCGVVALFENLLFNPPFTFSMKRPCVGTCSCQRNSCCQWLQC